MLPRPTILHADADAFFAAVEQRDDPALRGQPVVVGGGVVMAASYEARAYGVRGAMGGGKARRLCPDLVVVRPRFDAYVAASRAVLAVFRRLTPVVEAVSMEEAFLDVAGVDGEPAALAARLRREVLAEAGLRVTVGVARTKVLAKLASRAAKPDGLLVVGPSEEEAFLHPLAVGDLWGVGPAGARKLRAAGLRTVGDAAALGEAGLKAILGKAAGRYVHAVAHNLDSQPVRPRRERRSFGAQSALGRAPRTVAALEAELASVVERVAGRMRRAGRAGRTVVLRVRFGDYARATRSRTLARATSDPEPLLHAARALLAAATPAIERRGCTLLGITVTNLDGEEAAGQLSLGLEAGSA